MVHSVWKHADTKYLVEQRYGTERAEKVFDASLSVHWKLLIASFHASEIRKITRSVIPNEAKAIEKMLLRASGSKKAISYVKAQFRCEAHLMACAHAIHSVGDIVSHVIWHSMNLITVIPDERKVSLSTVSCAIEGLKAAHDVAQSLNDLSNSDAFTYVTAYVNTTKHRRVVDNSVSISLDPNPPRYGFRIGAFDYKGRDYPKTWFDTLSEQYRDSVQDAIVNIGNSLNEWLSNQTSGITRVRN